MPVTLREGHKDRNGEPAKNMACDLKAFSDGIKSQIKTEDEGAECHLVEGLASVPLVVLLGLPEGCSCRFGFKFLFESRQSSLERVPGPVSFPDPALRNAALPPDHLHPPHRTRLFLGAGASWGRGVRAPG